MATNLNSGYTNNINTIQIRSDGNHSIRVTDRKIDYNSDGNKEQVTITHVSGHAAGTPSSPGGKIKQTITTPTGVARTIIVQNYETDGGVEKDLATSEYTEGS